ncbi:MAG: endolytic transglycosylase MltG [Blautia sp.]|nr:endolytic transglycosylase MltG [Blautia sp.]
MGNARDKIAKVGVFLAGTFFKIVLYVCVILLLYWVGSTTYKFGHDVFNQQPVSPGEGQEITVVIPEGASTYEIGKILKNKGLIKDEKVFLVQEFFSNYHKQMVPGTYLLSTAYTPNRIMGILAGDTELEGTETP